VSERKERDKKANLYQRILAIMQDVPYIQKTEKKVNNQYTFVSHDDVTAKVRVALIAHGVLAMPTVESNEFDGNVTKCNLTMRFINVDTPTEIIEVKSFGYGIDKQDKGPGKAMSYAVKYALLKALCLETGDDPERDTDTEAEPSASNDKALADKADAAIASFSQSVRDGLKFLKEKKSWTSFGIRKLVIEEKYDELGVSLTLKNVHGLKVTANIAAINAEAAEELDEDPPLERDYP